MKKLIILFIVLYGAGLNASSSGSWEETTITGSKKRGVKIITKVFIYSNSSHKKPVKKEITTVVTRKHNKKKGWTTTVKTVVKKVKRFKSLKVVPNGKKKKKTKNKTNSI